MNINLGDTQVSLEHGFRPPHPRYFLALRKAPFVESVSSRNTDDAIGRWESPVDKALLRFKSVRVFRS